MKAITPLLQQLQPHLARLENLLNSLRTRIPGLPSNRALLAAGGLLIGALALLATFQILLAPRQKFTTYTLPYEQSFEEVNLRRWFVGEGVWSIRTGTLAQTVGGEGVAQIHIPFKLPEDTSYHASVYITLKKDSRAAGISFNAQYPTLTEKQHRVYLSRPDAETLELVSGYMDENGSFVIQEQVRLPINTTEFRLDLYVYEEHYLVQVNGQRMIENRPLIYQDGLIGFYALGPAVFDTFKLTAADNPNPGDMVYASDFDQDPGGAGWVPFSGSWNITDKQMLQNDPAAQNAGMGYETSTFQNFTLRVNFQHISGQGAGLLFNMPSPYQINGAQVVRYSDETDALIWGYFDGKGTFNRQGFANLPPPETTPHTLQIFSGETSYDIFLDETLIARDVPLQSAQGCVGLFTSAASAGYRSVEVYPLFEASQPLTPIAASPTPTPTPTPSAPAATQAPAATPLAPAGTPIRAEEALSGGAAPFSGTFTGKLSEQGWKVLSGNWLFDAGQLVQLRTDGYDFSAVYTKTAFTEYSYQAGFSHLQNSGAGLVFNLPHPDRLAGASMVRYSDRRDNALIWGYFDQNGVYKNQGYADVNPAESDRHTLRIDSGATSYSVYLDDRLIVQNVPFGTKQNAGYIGLLTSVASVAYDEVTVNSLGAAFRGNYASLDGFTDQQAINGKWTMEGNSLSQTVPDPADYLWNTGVQASQYSISAKITLPAGDSDTGGGFILHMSERGSKKNAYIVRLTQGGNGIWWGSTDENGKFKGQGSAPLQPSKVFLLKVVVDRGKMTVFVNGKEIAANLPIAGVEGWVGLTAYGGPVRFEDVTLEVEQ